MSIPFLSITCNDCDFRGSSFATTGRFLWSHEGRNFQFERRLGLCLDCNKIVAIEDLPDPKTMERARSIRAGYTGQPLLRLLEPDYAKYLASQVGFEVLEEVLALDRQPVCLECGKSAVRPIDVPEGVNSEVQFHSILAIRCVQVCFKFRIRVRYEWAFVPKHMRTVSMAN